MTTRTELIARLRTRAHYPSFMSAEQCNQAADMLEADGKLFDELERERMRLAACGVVAMSDTPDSAKKARDMHPD